MPNLYQIQDSDRPMFVTSISWQHALDTWKCQMAKENECSIGDVEEPDGINLLATEDEILIGSSED